MLNYDTIKSFYIKGLWNEQLVKVAVKKGLITEEQANEILSVKEE